MAGHESLGLSPSTSSGTSLVPRFQTPKAPPVSFADRLGGLGAGLQGNLVQFRAEGRKQQEAQDRRALLTFERGRGQLNSALNLVRDDTSEETLANTAKTLDLNSPGAGLGAQFKSLAKARIFRIESIVDLIRDTDFGALIAGIGPANLPKFAKDHPDVLLKAQQQQNQKKDQELLPGILEKLDDFLVQIDNDPKLKKELDAKRDDQGRVALRDLERFIPRLGTTNVTKNDLDRFGRSAGVEAANRSILTPKQGKLAADAAAKRAPRTAAATSKEERILAAALKRGDIDQEEFVRRSLALTDTEGGASFKQTMVVNVDGVEKVISQMSDGTFRDGDGNVFKIPAGVVPRRLGTGGGPAGDEKRLEALRSNAAKVGREIADLTDLRGSITNAVLTFRGSAALFTGGLAGLAFGSETGETVTEFVSGIGAGEGATKQQIVEFQQRAEAISIGMIEIFTGEGALTRITTFEQETARKNAKLLTTSGDVNIVNAAIKSLIKLKLKFDMVGRLQVGEPPQFDFADPVETVAAFRFFREDLNIDPKEAKTWIKDFRKTQEIAGKVIGSVGR